MGVNSKIEWCDDSWNFIVGCTRVSSGCANCYAVNHVWRMAANPNPKIREPRKGVVEQQPNGMLDWTGKIGVLPDRLLIPFRKQQPTRYFVNSLSDLFHENVPDELIDRAFAVMALTPRHTYQVLTKRPDRMRRYAADPDAAARIARFSSFETIISTPGRIDVGGDVMARWHREGVPWPLPNVWLGTSVENQKAADARIPELLGTPAAVRFLSCEPLLGPVDLHPPAPAALRMLSRFYTRDAFDPSGSQPETDRDRSKVPNVDWVIVGGESGPRARPMHPDWARSLRDQCVAAGIPFFFKQVGEWLAFDQSQRPPEDDPIWSSLPLISGRRSQGLTVEGRLKGSDPWVEGRDTIVSRVGKRRAGRELDGRTWDEYPAAAGIQPAALAAEHA